MATRLLAIVPVIGMTGTATLNEFFSKIVDQHPHPAVLEKLKYIYNSINMYSKENDLAVEDLRILDVACGRGAVTLPLASLGCQVKAFDINKDSIKHILDKKLGNVEVISENAETFFDGQKYDIVIASEVVEHLESPQKFANNIINSLHKNSYLIITVPNGYCPEQIYKRAFFYRMQKSDTLRRILNKPRYIYIPGEFHLHYYTKEKIITLFSGLELVKSGNSNLPFYSIELNNKIKNILPCQLPYKLSIDWYFTFKKVQ